MPGHAGLSDRRDGLGAAYVNFCLRLSGYMGTSSALAASFAHFGVDLGQVPQAGCIVVFWPPAGTSSGHVGFYVGEEAKNIKSSVATKATRSRYRPFRSRSGARFGGHWQILTTLIASFGGLGVLSKVDRIVQILGVIANSLPKSTASP